MAPRNTKRVRHAGGQDMGMVQIYREQGKFKKKRKEKEKETGSGDGETFTSQVECIEEEKEDIDTATDRSSRIN